MGVLTSDFVNMIMVENLLEIIDLKAMKLF